MWVGKPILRLYIMKHYRIEGRSNIRYDIGSRSCIHVIIIKSSEVIKRKISTSDFIKI